jgi:lysyl-tRNA synthetase class 2
MTSISPWWSPHRHADRRPFLLARGRIQAALRGWFAEREFLEVETSVLQVSPGNEAHLHAFRTALEAPGAGAPGAGAPGAAPGAPGAPIYLRTSPEFACKKLLAAGERRIVDFARVFRNRERGALHAPEFTLVEWYRAGEPYAATMQDCLDLLCAAAEAAHTRQLTYRQRSADPFAAAQLLTVAEAFDTFAGIDLMAALADGAPDRDAFAAAARAAGIRLAADDSFGDIFSRVLTERIEPRLGEGRPTILYEYPSVQSALARPTAKDPRLAERFELYVCGVELANGFGELTDAAQQRSRLHAEMDVKQHRYGERYPLDEDFLAALAVMPQASGVALGFDRLVMLATAAPRIDDVLWTPPPEPAPG